MSDEEQASEGPVKFPDQVALEEVLGVLGRLSVEDQHRVLETIRIFIDRGEN